MIGETRRQVVVTVVTVVMALLGTGEAQEGGECHLPSGSAASCVDISRCSHLNKLIANLQRPFPGDVTLLIRDSFLCGAGTDSVSVCCPTDGVSPALEPGPSHQDREGCGMQQGAQAECVTYNQCSPFVQLLVNLKKPLDPVVPSMVRSSFLCGAEEVEGRTLPKICCPSAALAVKKPAEPTNVHLSHPAMRQLADPEKCGIATADFRIVGGQDAQLGQFPWLVNLGYQQAGKGDTLFKCGGTLIGPKHVITAAHCVTDLPRGFQLTKVRVGEHDLDSDVDCDGCQPAQDMGIEKVVFHPSYGKPEAFQNDIAVIKLSEDVTENDLVHPICLPVNDDNDNYIDVGRSAASGAAEAITEVAGWGATTITGRIPATVLQFLTVNVTDSGQCKEIYAERGGVLGEKQICAGGQKGKDSCVGDSGSGLMRSLPNFNTGIDRWDLIGVVSFGPRLCGTEGVPGVYARVNSYLDWILDTVGDS